MWLGYDRTFVTSYRSDPDPTDIGMRYLFNAVVEIPVTDTDSLPIAQSNGFDPSDNIWAGNLDDLSAPNPMFDNFNITVDQLEGEINLPYNVRREVIIVPATEASSFTIAGTTVNIPAQPERPYVIQSIEVPRSALGGFAQFRINFQYLYSAEGGDGRVISGEIITPRVLVPRYVEPDPPPPPPVFTVDDNQIREALADKVYDLFFNSDIITENVDDLKTLQSTRSPDGIGYKTGRESDDDQLIFFKKDRNTPENTADFYDDGIRDVADEVGLSGIITDIIQSYANTDADGIIDLTEKLNNNLTVGEPSVSDEFEEIIEGDEIYYCKTWVYNLQYNTENPPGIINLPFASYKKFYSTNTSESPYFLPSGEQKPVEWINKLNLSQLTKPVLGLKTDVSKAKNVLDTNIFELLPNQSQRQNEINEFFQKFQSLIGNKPAFEDVDGDGAGEQIDDLQLTERISTAEDKESAFITRLNSEADGANQNKTLQSMRDELNEYLGDVDNVIEEFPELPEYENKSEGFLKIRNLNQAIIIRNNTDIMPLLEERTVTEVFDEPIFISTDQVITEQTVTGPSWAVDGFTITMWVRFLNSTTGGSLMTFGNPILKNLPGFRLDTHTRSDFNADNNITTNRRMVRLVVWENSFNPDGAIYDSHFGRDFTPNPDGRGAKYQTWQPGANPAYEEFAEVEDGSWHVFMQHTQIPTDDLDEWFFICATYDPLIDEEGSFEEVILYRDTDFWLNKKGYDGSIVSNSGFGNKCKVEVISRSDLLRARGFRV